MSRKGKEKAVQAGVERLPNGLEVRAMSELTPAVARAIYARDQMLLLRCSADQQAKCAEFGPEVLQELFVEDPDLYTDHFTVENPGSRDVDELGPVEVFGACTALVDPDPFYVSSILQRSNPANPVMSHAAAPSTSDALARFFAAVPLETPGLLEAEHEGGVWLFFGHNPPPDDDDYGDDAGEERDTEDAEEVDRMSTNKRRKTDGGTTGTHAGDGDGGGGGGGGAAEPSQGTVIAGRPEHVDKVDHSGTWHLQLSGSKTWYIRPQVDAQEWAGSPPVLGEKPGTVAGLGGTRLEVEVQQGEVLIINTRSWWHRTEISPQQCDSGLSISYARDFYLPGAKGKLSAAEIDGNRPTFFESQTVAHDSNGSSLDPRLHSAYEVGEGELCLDEHELPDPADFPKAAEPNAKLVVAEIDGEERVVLVATRAISVGEPFTLAPDDDDEYDAWELDMKTGEMAKVAKRGARDESCLDESCMDDPERDSDGLEERAVPRSVVK